MSRYKILKAQIDANSALTGLLEETAELMRQYGHACRATYNAIRASLAAETKEGGSQTFGIPFHPEQVLAEFPDGLKAFLIARVELLNKGDSDDDVASGLRELREKYRGLVPKPC